MPEEAVHNLGTWYKEEQYGTYEYEKEKGVGNGHIKLWYRQYECLLTSLTLSLINDCYCHFLQYHPQFSPRC